MNIALSFKIKFQFNSIFYIYIQCQYGRYSTAFILYVNFLNICLCGLTQSSVMHVPESISFQKWAKLIAQTIKTLEPNF